MAKRIPKTFIQDLLARVDIIDIIQPRVSLQKRGQNYLACCPFHQEKTPSFTVSPVKQFYYCFGCGANGNTIGFLMAFDRLDFPDAIAYLASQLGLEIPYEAKTSTIKDAYSELYVLLAETAKFYQQKLRSSSLAINYLKSRGLSGQTAKDFGLGYAPNQWDSLLKHFHQDKTKLTQLKTTGMVIEKDNYKQYDRFRHRIMFPIHDIRGNIVGFGGRTVTDELPKYLNSPETPIYHKTHELYGLYEARKKNRNLEQVLIVEGYMDVIALAEYGIDYAVATLGTAINIRHAQKLLRYTSKLIFCFDGDHAGQQASWKAISICLPLLNDGIEIGFLFLPENEDPDSLIRKLGKEKFEQGIATRSKSLSDVFFTALTRKHPLNTPDSKAHFAKVATNYLNTMPQGLYQQLLYDKLAELLFMNRDDLTRINLENNAKPTAKQGSISVLSPVQHALTLLLQQPTLVEQIRNINFLHTIDVTGKALLLQVLMILKKEPSLSTGQLLARIESPEDKHLLALLSARTPAIPESGIAEEFLGAIERLEEINRQQLIQKLIDKAKQETLSPMEKQHLQTLLAQKEKASK